MISRVRSEVRLSDIFLSLLPVPKPQDSLERGLKQKFGFRNAVLLPSARSGIYFMLSSMKQKDVFLPAFDCRAGAEAVLIAGKKPHYIDVDLDTFNMSPRDLEKKIKPNSIVLATHQFGIPCEIDKIKRICEKKGAVFLEDSAAALASKYRGEYCGSFGSASVFSFDFSKAMTTARGGLLVANNKKFAEGLRTEIRKFLKKPSFVLSIKKFISILLHCIVMTPAVYAIILPFWARRNGLFSDTGELDTRRDSSYICGMTQFQAKIGLRGLRRLDWVVKRRKQIMQYYLKELSSCRHIALPKWPVSAEPVLIRFPIRLLKGDKLEFYRHCASRGVDLGFSFSYSCASLAGDTSCPNAEKIKDQVLNLPFYSRLSDSDLKKVVNAVKSFGEKTK